MNTLARIGEGTPAAPLLLLAALIFLARLGGGDAGGGRRRRGPSGRAVDRGQFLLHNLSSAHAQEVVHEVPVLLLAQTEARELEAALPVSLRIPLALPADKELEVVLDDERVPVDIQGLEERPRVPGEVEALAEALHLPEVDLASAVVIHAEVESGVHAAKLPVTDIPELRKVAEGNGVPLVQGNEPGLVDVEARPDSWQVPLADCPRGVAEGAEGHPPDAAGVQ